MLIQKKNIIGMILCIMLFSASVPILMGVKTSPDSIFKGEEVITLSQTNTKTPVLESLAYRLDEQDFVEVASPEIIAFSYTISRKTGNYEPVLVRGVVPEYFFRIEDAHLKSGHHNGNFMLVGEELVKRLGIDIGDSVTITGSTTPAILELTVSGIFSSEGVSDNQILVSLDDARTLMGVNRDDVLIIRVKTHDQENLEDFLTEQGVSVIVSSEDGIPISINENKTFEEEVAEDLAIKYTDTDDFRASNESFLSTFIQRGRSTIGVVVLGFIILDALLTFVGVTAILARAVIEKKKDIGILASIGADKKAIYKLLLKDLLIISIIAAGIGVIIGYAVAVITQNLGLVVAFGHTIQPTIDIMLFAIIFIVAVVIGCSSGLMVSSIIMTARPSSLMREIEEVEEDAQTETLVEAIGV